MTTKTKAEKKEFSTKEELLLFFKDFLDLSKENEFDQKLIDNLSSETTSFWSIPSLLRQWAFEQTQPVDGSGRFDNENELVIGNRSFSLSTRAFLLTVSEVFNGEIYDKISIVARKI